MNSASKVSRYLPRLIQVRHFAIETWRRTNTPITWGAMPLSPVEVYRRFGWITCFHYNWWWRRQVVR